MDEPTIPAPTTTTDAEVRGILLIVAKSSARRDRHRPTCSQAKGRREERRFDGVIGISWALFIAGSPSTVASQWKVEADSTARMVVEFHRNLQRASMARALQQAALEVMKTPKHRHSFYWLGFVLMGKRF